MLVKRSSKKPGSSSINGKKESILKELSRLLSESGYTVRREKLKRGHGWRVMSGDCRAQGRDLIFVDRRMSQDDQISFLVSRMRSLGVAIDDEASIILPEKIVSCFQTQA